MELLITVYVHYVRSALSRQRFYRYEDVSETGTFVKGKIDLRDYITNKMPSGNIGQIKYTYSSFMFDNLLNRIIKCTCRELSSLTNQDENKRIIKQILMSLSEVTEQQCVPTDCDRIHLSNLQSMYQIILSMSKMFLMNRSANVAMGETDNFCFLFPAEVLFEGFIGGFLKEMLASKAKVTTQASDQYLAELVVNGEVLDNVFQLREDILIEFNSCIIVLDTKYKEIDRFTHVRENKRLHISDNDMKQMAIYALKRGAKELYLLYPLHIDEEPENIEVLFNIKLPDKTQDISIPLEVLKVPFAFREDMFKTRELLRKILSKVDYSSQN